MEWKDHKTPSKITSVNLNATQIAVDVVHNIHNTFANHLFYFYLFFKAY